MDLSQSVAFHENGHPSGESSVAVKCADSSQQPILLSYADFIPGEKRRAIMDWDWKEKTSFLDLVSCIILRGLPNSHESGGEVYVFGILTYDDRIDGLGRRVRELSLIAKQLPVKSKILGRVRWSACTRRRRSSVLFK